MEESTRCIAVLRGGRVLHGPSITTGATLLASLSRHGADVIDVYIDTEGVWHKHGVPTTMYAVLPRVDAYIDLAGVGDECKNLAKKLGVRELSESDDASLYGNREITFRLLRQHGVPVASMEYVRRKDFLNEAKIHELWRSMIGPLYIRNVTGQAQGAIVYSLSELLQQLIDRETVSDVHIMRYRKEKPRSLAVLSSYRGEDVYIPLSVETQVGPKELPRREKRIVPLTYLGSDEKDTLHILGKKVYSILGNRGHILIDYVKAPSGIEVVEVTKRPSLLQGGRFHEALATTGVDLGHYFLSRI